jgi:hypothetical protein
MSALGKLLAVLNVLAAIAFVVIAGMDWGQRQRWAYAAYLHAQHREADAAVLDTRIAKLRGQEKK